MFKIISLLLAMITVGCSTPNRRVYSSGFSFSNYDYVIMYKPDSSVNSTAMYGMDVEFANLLSRVNMKVIGDKEYDVLPIEIKKRSLNVRLSLISSGSNGSGTSLLSVSFDDAVSGKTVANFIEKARGDMFDFKDRTYALDSVSRTITRAIASEKGLEIIDKK